MYNIFIYIILSTFPLNNININPLTHHIPYITTSYNARK